MQHGSGHAAGPVYASTVNNLVARTSKVEYSGESQSWHLLHYLVEEIGLDKVRDAVKNPLKMNIAAYYGPDMQRDGACAGDDPFMPTYMEQLIEALGGHPVDYDSKCMSVGSTSMLTLEDSSLAMTAAVRAIQRRGRSCGQCVHDLAHQPRFLPVQSRQGQRKKNQRARLPSG